ncbi:MAG TPA: hypothetical protein VGH74_13710 [Planctomycetaceae bacterium]
MASARVGDQNDRIGLYSVADGREYRSLVRPGGSHAASPVLATAIHPGGRLAALGHTSGGDGDLAQGVALFDLETGRGPVYIPFKTVTSAVNTHFDEAGNLFTNSFDGLFRWPVRRDTVRGDTVRPETAPPGRWTIGPPQRLPFQPSDCSVSTSRDGRVIAQCMWLTGSMPGGGWILLPDSQTPRCVQPGSCTGACSVSPDGRWVAFTQPHLHPINIYDTETCERVWQSPANCGWHCRFSRDGRWLVTDVEGGRLYNVGTWEPGPQLGSGQPQDMTADLAILALPNGVYRLVEVPEGRELARLEDPDQNCGPASFTPDGTKLVVAARDGVRVWDLRGIRRELARLGLDWDAPPYPPADEKNDEPLDVVVDLGSLGP